MIETLGIPRFKKPIAAARLIVAHRDQLSVNSHSAVSST
jgi:hypothetical protein